MTTYTRTQVAEAVNGAADLLLESANLTPDTTTLIDFVVNAALTRLEAPDATVEDVIAENWGVCEDEDCDGEDCDDGCGDAAVIRRLVTGD
ncbi:hypothetical protein [Dietzia sp. 179-F 9C3 NHS]|uniref:hypothetical protein n=1 Tax=Dietzia sp. 179-F 9C3 NHS TaxID=3374295 RepID=UPI003879B63A